MMVLSFTLEDIIQQTPGETYDMWRLGGSGQQPNAGLACRRGSVPASPAACQGSGAYLLPPELIASLEFAAGVAPGSYAHSVQSPHPEDRQPRSSSRGLQPACMTSALLVRNRRS